MAPELTTDGIGSLLRVATATDDPVMQVSWLELEERIIQNLDLFSDDQIGRLLRIPHWQEVIKREQSRLSPEMRVRLDALQPRSTIGRLWHSFRRKLESWILLGGLTLADADEVLRVYRAKVTAAKHLMRGDGHIALMNEAIAARFPDLDEAHRSVRFYFYERENLIGAS